MIDDHLLRDWMARRDPALIAAIGEAAVSTTNLWYARLCKSAVRATGGALLQGWADEERHALVSALISLPGDIDVTPMRTLAWRMGELIADHRGLSLLGAEAVAAAEAADASILVSARDDGPGIRATCAAVGVTYDALDR